MSNNRVRDVNSAELKGNNQKKTDSEKNSQIQITHGNAPLLTVKYLDMVLIELKKITARLEKIDG